MLGSGLLAKGCQPNPQQFIGIFAQNRPEVPVLSLLLYCMFTPQAGNSPISRTVMATSQPQIGKSGCLLSLIVLLCLPLLAVVDHLRAGLLHLLYGSGAPV